MLVNLSVVHHCLMVSSTVVALVDESWTARRANQKCIRNFLLL